MHGENQKPSPTVTFGNFVFWFVKLRSHLHSQRNVNILFRRYASSSCCQEFPHAHAGPFSLFHLCKVTISDSTHELLSVLASPTHPRGSAFFYLWLLFCFKSLHSDAAQLPIWASKGPWGLTRCLTLHPQLVSLLRANCRLCSVCRLMAIFLTCPHFKVPADADEEVRLVSGAFCRPLKLVEMLLTVENVLGMGSFYHPPFKTWSWNASVGVQTFCSWTYKVDTCLDCSFWFIIHGKRSHMLWLKTERVPVI